MHKLSIPQTYHILIVSNNTIMIKPMPNNLNLDPILIILALLLLLLYLKEYFYGRSLKNNPAKLLEENHFKAYDILHKAIQKAQSIIGGSEIEALKFGTQTRIATKNLQEKYEQSIIQSQADFRTYLDNLSRQAAETVVSSEDTIKIRINRLFEEFEQNLSNYLTGTQQQSLQAIEFEMQSARGLIETYKIAQLKLIDENVVAMLERTLSLVLVKKLSLKEQVDLVYESLEKAKAEKFIV